MKHNFCTYFDWAYLYKGLALHESLERHCSDFHLWILGLDKPTVDTLASLGLSNTSIISMDSFNTLELQRACADRTTQERYWTYTPRWINYVLKNAPVDHVAYVDADIAMFLDPALVFDELRGKGVGITPHRFPPKYISFITSGLYNVGMVYVERDHAKGRACINEWERLCVEWCYYRHDPNDPYRFCDQLYWDRLVPEYNAHSIQHLGANLAPWNVEGYQYSMSGNHLHVNGQPLIWYHFHGLQMIGGNVVELHPSSYTPPPIIYQQVYGPYQQALNRAIRKVGR